MSTEKQPMPGRSVRELFLGALDRPPAERPSFLERECAGDGTVRGEVEELLREHERLGTFLEQPALDPAFESTLVIPPGTVAVREREGDRIGRYKLLQKLGEGGCGIVYMAEQVEPMRRRVALKIIKLGMDTKSVIARFEAERQALAMMDHPNIARVLDAGATETGRPYFVMELVRGVRITAYCDENHLTTPERLELFVEVCQAIQHAHQKGIIHRDIKPSNILVTLHDGVPVPKVIDFGIAKATEQPLTDKTLFTEFQSFIGTPAYMSPEQAEMSGLDLDTRSDIYALGVLLYEMLTGTTPFDPQELMKLGLEGVRRAIRDEEPSRPSTRVATMVDAQRTATATQRRTEAPRLIHSLRGDLDWIAMKCLEKDRARRYATAHDLAAEVQRFLAGDPVEARPPSNVYRLQKFLRRHRGAVSAAAAVTLALITGTVVSTWMAVRARQAERGAERAEKLESSLRLRAEQESATARLNEYVSDINLAEQSRLAGNYGRAVQLLNKHRPAPGELDLRGFEWRYLWQLTRGDQHIEFPSQEEPVLAVALSPTGEWLAVGSERKLNIWNARTRALVHTQPRGASSLAFVPDSTILIAADPRTVRLLLTSNWTERGALPGAGSPIALSRNGTRVATGGRDGVRIWNTATWEQTRLIREAVPPLAMSPDGQRVAADMRFNGGLCVWPVDDAARKVSLHDSTNLHARALGSRERALAFSPDGRSVVAGRNTLSERGVFVLSIWDSQTGEELGSMPQDPEHIEHTGSITSAAFSPDGKTLATASMDYSIRVWDFEKRQRLTALHGHLNEVQALAFAPDGQHVASGARGGGVKLWPTQPHPEDEEFAGARVPLAFSTNGALLAALSRSNTILFLDLKAGAAVNELVLEPPRPASPPPGFPRGPAPVFRMILPMPLLGISADLRTVATAQFDGTVKRIHTDSGESTTWPAADPGTAALALSPDARTLVTAGWNGDLRWWDVRHGTNIVLPSAGGRALFSPDSRTLALFHRQGGIEFWDVATRTMRTNLMVDPAPMLIGASAFPAGFSPDAALLAMACDDDSIRLLDVRRMVLVGALVGHKQNVYTVAFSPDGKTIATASDDSTLKFWNVATQQELFSIRRLGGGLRALHFSPDGRLLVAGTSSTLITGGLRVFRAPLFSEIGSK
jgi:WD40 repeat protein/serine/threonine protein kinase